MNDDGSLNENCGEKFNGMKRFTARKVVIEELTKLGLYVETKDNPMQVPRCAKSRDVIEPIMKPQWWVSQKSMADAAIEVGTLL
jgi:valyl-tRNA synthetase